MKKQYSLEQLKNKYGRDPDLMVETDETFLEESRIDDDIADRYVIYFNDQALGGSIVYGQYGYGEKTWMVNPHLRYVVKRLSEMLINK